MGKMGFVQIRYYLDPETGEPHIYRHGVSEDEVEAALEAEGQTLVMVPTELVPALAPVGTARPRAHSGLWQTASTL